MRSPDHLEQRDSATESLFNGRKKIVLEQLVSLRQAELQAARNIREAVKPSEEIASKLPILMLVDQTQEDAYRGYHVTLYEYNPRENEIYESLRSVSGQGTINSDHDLERRGIYPSGNQAILYRRKDHRNWLALAPKILNMLEEATEKISKGEEVLPTLDFRPKYSVGGCAPCLFIPPPDLGTEGNSKYYKKEIALMAEREIAQGVVRPIYSSTS